MICLEFSPLTHRRAALEGRCLRIATVFDLGPKPAVDNAACGYADDLNPCHGIQKSASVALADGLKRNVCGDSSPVRSLAAPAGVVGGPGWLYQTRFPGPSPFRTGSAAAAATPRRHPCANAATHYLSPRLQALHSFESFAQASFARHGHVRGHQTQGTVAPAPVRLAMPGERRGTTT